MYLVHILLNIQNLLLNLRNRLLIQHLHDIRQVIQFRLRLFQVLYDVRHLPVQFLHLLQNRLVAFLILYDRLRQIVLNLRHGFQKLLHFFTQEINAFRILLPEQGKLLKFLFPAVILRHIFFGLLFMCLGHQLFLLDRYFHLHLCFQQSFFGRLLLLPFLFFHCVRPEQQKQQNDHNNRHCPDDHNGQLVLSSLRVISSFIQVIRNLRHKIFHRTSFPLVVFDCKIWKSVAKRHRSVPRDARNKVYFKINPKIVKIR